MWQRLANELLFRAIARNLNIAVSAVHSTWKLFKQTGDVQPSPTPHEPRRDQRKLDDALELFLVCLVLERPEMYLHEICQDILDQLGLKCQKPQFAES